MIALVLALAAGATAPDAIAKAQEALQRGDYAAAAEDLTEASVLSPRCEALEYDIGTASAEAEQVGPAILHLERALRERPWDSEARQNLERIREKRVDKVMGQEPGEAPLQRLIAEVPGRSFFWLGLLGWWAGFLMLAFGTARADARPRWLPVVGILLAISLVGVSLAWQMERNTPYAIVVTGATKGLKVHAGPAADLPTSFEVHDGLKVLILDTENGFTHIRLGNGLEGYVADGEVQAI